MPNTNNKNKSALVTGAVRRIGKGIALFLAKNGYNIALHYGSSYNDAQKTAAAIRETGIFCKTFKCDLSQEEQVLSLLPRVTKTFPNLTLLVNNASIFKKAAIADTDTEKFNRHIAVNLKAPFFLTRDFARLCKTGHVINILDSRITHTHAKRDNYAVYTLSKKALAELTRMSAVEFAPDIRVNAVAPGLIFPPAGKSDNFLNEKAQNIPLKRKGAVADIVKAVQYLLESEFITGQILYVDGGEHL